MAAETEAQDASSSPVYLILGIVLGVLFLFLGGNALLWYYANKNVEPRTSRGKVSKKKLARDRQKEAARAPRNIE